ncbi:ABC transporter ATP-binding protein [Bacillus cereus group sp. N21]|uniref:ABC transporter ATP-binding protein n=1 Tax=Bacillus cereus group sp. N21 TaxID=2794591 RepID=UPI0018F615AD|nr:ABC transporter ATP-binding protein [Bacillus cereus group sp. N21]MBJ8027399.1 ABC transporter ATP-binding protein [Bacillus cereus group sp. N21]
MTSLYTEHLELTYGENTIIHNLELHIPNGKITALVGRNGCGKSTILKSLARLLQPTKGNVYLDGKAIQTMPTKEVAKKLAILPQSPTAPEGLTVEGLVWHGRYPHQRLLGKRSDQDYDMVNWALRVTSMTEFKSRTLDELSGGQRQRVWIAMALAQDTELLLLDEPTTYLDMAHQLEVLELLKKLNEEENRTVIMVVHDLNHAAKYAHHLVAIKDGNKAMEGAPKEILNDELFENVFGVKARVTYDEIAKTYMCTPYALMKEEKEVHNQQMDCEVG